MIFYHKPLIHNKYKTALMLQAFLLIIAMFLVLLTKNRTDTFWSEISILTGVGFSFIILFPIFWVIKKALKTHKILKTIFKVLFFLTFYETVIGGIIFIIEIFLMRSFLFGGEAPVPIYFILPGFLFNYALLWDLFDKN